MLGSRNTLEFRFLFANAFPESVPSGKDNENRHSAETVFRQRRNDWTVLGFKGFPSSHPAHLAAEGCMARHIQAPVLPIKQIGSSDGPRIYRWKRPFVPVTDARVCGGGANACDSPASDEPTALNRAEASSILIPRYSMPLMPQGLTKNLTPL